MVDANGLGCELIQIALLCEDCWRNISETCLGPLPVVEHFDVLGDLVFSLLPGGIAPVVDELVFQCTPEAFDGRVIVAVALATHRGDHAEVVEQTSVGMRTILVAFMIVVYFLETIKDNALQSWLENCIFGAESKYNRGEQEMKEFATEALINARFFVCP